MESVLEENKLTVALSTLAMRLKEEGYRIFTVNPAKYANEKLATSTYFYFTNGNRLIYVEQGRTTANYKFSVEYKPTNRDHGSGVVLFESDDPESWKETMGIEPLRHDPKRATIPLGVEYWDIDDWIGKERKWWKDRFVEL